MTLFSDARIPLGIQDEDLKLESGCLFFFFKFLSLPSDQVECLYVEVLLPYTPDEGRLFWVMEGYISEAWSFPRHMWASGQQKITVQSLSMPTSTLSLAVAIQIFLFSLRYIKLSNLNKEYMAGRRTILHYVCCLGYQFTSETDY